MWRLLGTLSDLTIAVAVGVVTEAILAFRGFELGSDLVVRHPWLQVSQMPRALMSELLFSHSGLFQAMIYALLIQAVLFSLVALGVIYAYRLIRGKTRRATAPP